MGVVVGLVSADVVVVGSFSGIDSVFGIIVCCIVDDLLACACYVESPVVVSCRVVDDVVVGCSSDDLDSVMAASRMAIDKVIYYGVVL